MEPKEFLIQWLNNTYAMEKGIEQNLKSMSNDAKDFPVLRRKIDDHIKITKNHANMVGNRIIELGGDFADTKKLMSQFTAVIQGLTMKMMPYKNLKKYLFFLSFCFRMFMAFLHSLPQIFHVFFLFFFV